MASLEAESLFSNIPLNETINNCASDLCNKNLSNGKLSKNMEYYISMAKETFPNF